MKITKTLSRPFAETPFFFAPNSNEALCEAFVESIIRESSKGKDICRATLSTKDQKEKGYRKVTRKDFDEVSFKKRMFDVCSSERKILDLAKIKIGDCFWVKIELA